MKDLSNKIKTRTSSRKLNPERLNSRRRQGLTLEELKNKYLSAEKATA